ncbi:helix-turn-helix domain-containing protein [Erwiniaceae bacterium BAC15a-03b]|uniref:DNA-3-methyladenine glycosylase II n=1 Tax=Winslowiella arboricola TaxID=2978220 RepID=A0A9J6PHM1_9GAMM|nr:AlkA N-terminal domain-containing protein [Winslowiella arboricola]MCU5774217.1 helix-turn-helix domain-containing protein [Winslowiella arboricola]MCU5776850.1 helix-turn-helix domain-containing protein [Winslowiella arboricola]
MMDNNAAYQALTSRDARFDGVFFVGVTSTGIYCRPICPVKAPQQKNCLFFDSVEAAEKASFRPCLRCRPELAPGNAPVDSAHRIADLLVQRIDEGLTSEAESLEQIASQFGISSRQLRRIVQKELGVSPVEIRQTRRLLLAKQLLTETRLPVTEVAFASGFSSLRRFNDAFNAQYRLSPSRLRKEAADDSHPFMASETSTLQLSYRPPYDWQAMLAFLSMRAIKGVEHISENSYARTVRLGSCTGWVRVTHAAAKSALMVEFTHSLTPVLPVLLRRLRNLFDLSARPDLIASHLGLDPLFHHSLSVNPGLRVAGAFDGFEMAVRAILGQQITVKAATTIACRFADAFGEKIETPFPQLSRLSPLATRVCEASLDDIASLGIVSARSRCILAMAQACASGELRLEAGSEPEKAIAQLVTLPGIGPWTANYIAMRALRWPDAFPKEDIAVRNNLGGVSAKQAELMSQAWRPWRSYAVIHIWKNMS